MKNSLATFLFVAVLTILNSAVSQNLVLAQECTEGLIFSDGFEQGPLEDNWFFDKHNWRGTKEYTTDNPHSGNQCLFMKGSDLSPATSSFMQTVPPLDAESAHVSFWVRDFVFKEGSGGDGYFDLQLRDASGDFVLFRENPEGGDFHLYLQGGTVIHSGVSLSDLVGWSRIDIYWVSGSSPQVSISVDGQEIISTVVPYELGPLDNVFLGVGGQYYNTAEFFLDDFSITCGTSQDITGNLLAYYSFDSDISDDHGSNDLAQYGDVEQIPSGKLGGCMQFISGHLDDVDFDFPNNNSEFTLSLWMWVDPEFKNNNCTPPGYGYLVYFYIEPGTYNYNRPFIGPNSSNGPDRAFLINPTDDQLTPDGVWDYAQWHHVVYTYGNSLQTVYVDNEVVFSVTNTDPIDPINHFLIGDHWDNNRRNYVGLLDELGVWNRALDATEVGFLYNDGNGYNPTSSVLSPVAAFSTDPVSGYAPMIANFTDESTGDITTYLWNFGDGYTSTDQNPSHEYTTAGTYTVALTVTGPGGQNSIVGSTPVVVQSVSYGTTVIVHGYTRQEASPDNGLEADSPWGLAMARAIVDRVGAGDVFVIKDGGIAGPVYSVNLAQSEREAVIVFDWIDESDIPKFGFAEGAADALFALLLEGRSLELWDLDQLHFIAHSRGAVVASETIQRLGYFNQQNALTAGVDQSIHFTTLDPHPWDDSWIDCISDPGTASDNNVNKGIDLGLLTQGKGVVAWDCVAFADNYFQGKCSDIDGVLNGLATFPGIASNTQLDELIEESGLNEHSAVHSWYYGSINLSCDPLTDICPDGGGINIRPQWYEGIERASIGFNLSRHFSGADISTLNVNDPIELQPDNHMDLHKIFNGNLDHNYILSSDDPGWAYHGGGDQVDNDGPIHGKHLRLNQTTPAARHNILYVPVKATHFAFSYRVKRVNETTPELLKISIGSTDVYSLVLISKGKMQYRICDLSGLGLAGNSATISARLESGEGSTFGSVVWLDDFHFIIDGIEAPEYANKFKLYKASPVDLVVTAPDGKILSRDTNQIEYSDYTEYELTPGDTGATIEITYPLTGIYHIEVVSKPNAAPDDTYTLFWFVGGETVMLAENEPVGNIPANGYFYSTLDTGSVAGVVSAGGTGLHGVAVDLFDAEGMVLASTTTDSTGRYLFGGLNNGSYVVGISAPLGYIAVSETQDVEVKGLPQNVSLELTVQTVPLAMRGRGYWMHEVNAHLSGKGKPKESFEDMCNYMDLLRIHFNENSINAVNVFLVELTENCNQRMEALRATISPKSKATMNEKARAHLTALLLNMVSGKIHQASYISEDSATVSQAITYANFLIMDWDHDNDGLARDIAEMVNEGQSVAAGIIDLSTMDIRYKEQAESLPTDFALHQNYPNPFNPVTTISFALPIASEVRLEVFNALGQKVATLVDGFVAAGHHNVNWDGREAASGVYLYRLKAGEFVVTKKMVLLK